MEDYRESPCPWQGLFFSFVSCHAAKVHLLPCQWKIISYGLRYMVLALHFDRLLYIMGL